MSLTQAKPRSLAIADRIDQLVRGHEGLTQRVELLRREGKSDKDIYQHVSARAGTGFIGELDASACRASRASMKFAYLD